MVFSPSDLSAFWKSVIGELSRFVVSFIVKWVGIGVFLSGPPLRSEDRKGPTLFREFEVVTPP